jgi:hypothetical protein
MQRYRNSFLIVALSLFSASGGVFRDSLFRNPSSMVNLISEDNLRLNIHKWVLAKIETLMRPSNANSRMRAPDVTSAGISGFTFFWEDSARASVHQFDTVCRREIRVVPMGFDTTFPIVKMCTMVRPQVNYLHGEKGSTNYLVTFNDSTLYPTLRAYGDFPLNGLSSLGGSGSTTRATMCHWRNDTFLVVFQKNDNYLVMRKVYFNSSGYVTQSSRNDTLSIELTNPLRTISNPSIASDTQGNFVIQWLIGLTQNSKKLKCVAFNANREKIDSIEFSSPADSVGLDNRYDSAPLAAYADGSFGSVSWDHRGILFRSIKIGTPLVIDSVRLASGPSVRYPSITSNGKYIAAVWMADSLPGGSFIKIFGIRDTIKTGYIPFSSAANQIPINDVWIPSTKIPGKTTNAFALNCAMDSSGDIAATWPIDSIVNARLWANRGVRSDSGTWVSPVVRAMDNSMDSVCLFPGTVSVNHEDFQPSNNDSLRTYVRVGLDSADQTFWRPWTPAGDSAALDANTKGVYRFMQYKFVLYRGQDTLGTPVVRNFSARWNAKPRFMPLDSVVVNGVKVAGLAFGDTYTCFSRRDMVTSHVSVYDADAADTLFTAVRGCAFVTDPIDTLAVAEEMSLRAQCGPVATSDTTIVMNFTAHDQKGWSAADQTFSLRTRNSLPQLQVYALADTNNDAVLDTVKIIVSRSFNLPESDSIVLVYAAKDTNDPLVKATVAQNGILTDSTTQFASGRVVFRGQAARPMGDTLLFSFGDPDTTVTRIVYLRTNHFPSITSVWAGNKKIADRDTLSVDIGALLSLSVDARDTDAGYWDHLTFRFTYAGKDTSPPTGVFSFVPARQDSAMLITISDTYNQKDTLRFFMKSPWLEIDTSVNRVYTLAKQRLRDSLMMIIGAQKKDTVNIPIVNTGNDTLFIKALTFGGSRYSWLRITVPYASGPVIYDSLRSRKIDAVAVPPGDTRMLVAVINAENLAGDGVVRDTIVIFTSDFGHPSDSIFVNLEHNELPRIASIAIDYPSNKPYWLAKKNAATATSYVFPPHAKIALKFTEPMDTAGTQNAVRAYSVFDSLLLGTAPSIRFSHTWQNNDSMLVLSPVYSAPSTYYNGFMPPPGFFIPGDSIRLFVSSAFTDKAKTPHGPNNLDVKMNYSRLAAADTMVPLRVDSIRYDITSLSPASNDTGVALNTPIILAFSSPPLPGSIDSLLSGNRSLIVRSAYFSNAQINFSSIGILGNKVTFRPAKQFFYGDTITCYYRARWARDSLGYPVDLNKNGIPMSMFDSLNTEDDTLWKFIIKDVAHTAVSPGSNATGVSPKTVITISFSDDVSPACIDTSLRDNKAFIVTTLYSGGAQLVFDAVKIAKKSVSYRLARTIFYADTVFCSYQGLTTKDSAGYFIDITGRQLLYTSDKARWKFTVSDVVHTALSPADNATGVSPKTAITVTLSDSISPDCIDTALKDNKGLIVSSLYSRGVPLVFDSIRVAKNRVSYYPAHRFFYGDTVYCSYFGLTTKDSVRYSIDLAGRQLVSTNDRAQWKFFISDIKIVSVDPDSASSGPIAPRIVLNFSQPLFSGTFDDDTSAKNRSFALHSSFVSDSLLSFKEISFSNDGTQVFITPKNVFFSNDTLRCSFRGFAKTFRYDTTHNLPSADSTRTFGSYGWFFTTFNVGFYTYPNPYKPGLNKRHCSNPATDPCGIWFTNLHVLRQGIEDVGIKILSMNGNPIYSTIASGTGIHFRAGDPNQKPMWKWDTRNQRGEFVASGLYFYVITDAKGSALMKGKLIIVR